jgi:hypothetical protein
MPAGKVGPLDGMCSSSCCGPQQNVAALAETDLLPHSANTVGSVIGGIVAAESDPKAREALLYKLDCLVVGAPIVKVELTKDEVVALEAEARRALDQRFCLFCTQCKDTDTKEATAGKVVVVLTPKLASQWSPPISYPRLEFAEQDRQVTRPQFVSAFPAALILADPDKPTSLRFRVKAFPSNQTIFTVGVAKWPGFRIYFGKGFGEEEDSWGLQWRAQGGAPTTPEVCCLKLVKGDLVCITCDAWKGSSTISLNGREAGNFTIPTGETFVLGATLSTGCILRIEPQ